MIQVWPCGPESYDIFLADKQVGYVRLLNGVLSCSYLSKSGKAIYYGYPEGQNFFEPSEKLKFLEICVAVINVYLRYDTP